MDKLTNFERYQTLAVDRLVKADWNYKEEDEVLTTKLIENIKRNGQIENIIVRELGTGFYEIVNGNHRYEAMKAIGAESVVVCNLGPLTLTQAQRVAIETNETRFATNTARLATLIADIAKDNSIEDLVATMPYSQERLNEMIGLSEFDWDSLISDKADKSEGDIIEDDGDAVITLKVTNRDMERWEKWLRRAHDLTGSDPKHSLLILLTIADQMTDEAVQELV